jgi:predicted SAM-dependent methyltransferase
MSVPMSKFKWIKNPICVLLMSVIGSYRQTKTRRKQQRELMRALKLQPSKKIIVGSGGTKFAGWVPTDQEILNLLVDRDWAKFFKPNSLDAILAEHVWEHLTPGQAIIAAVHCFKFLKPDGYLRVAVPDGLHPDPIYIEWVKPDGNGPGSDDHKVLYNYRTLSALFENAGYKVRLLEWFDDQGKFHHQNWDVDGGFIMRSTRFDSRNRDSPTAYTSLIIDASKP